MADRVLEMRDAQTSEAQATYRVVRTERRRVNLARRRSPMLIEDRVRKLAQLAEGDGPVNPGLRAALRRELIDAVTTERKRAKLATVVAMSEEDAVRYRVISELASDWVYAVRVDEFGNLLFEWVTGSFEMVTGYRLEEVNERGGWVRVLHPADGDKMFAPDSPLMRGEPATVDYRVIGRSGEERWLRDYACPELDRSGARVVRLFGAVKDVTDEVVAQEALREAKQRLEQRVGFDEARFRAVLDQAGEAIFMIHPDTGGFIDVNQTACRMLGYQRDELLKMTIHDVEDRSADWLTMDKQELRKGLSYESYYRRKDMSQASVEIAVSLRRYIGEDYLLAVTRDITERKQMEIQLAQADRLASVGVLAAGVAHEINNPLVYILNNVSYALSELPAQFFELRDALREARSGAERVRDIVKDLKTFARSDERMGPMDVRQVLDSTLKVAHNELRFRARVETHYPERVPMVEANARLGQVFLNLLLNAAHSIREGEPLRNRIAITVTVEGKRVGVAIEDTGTGIPPARLTKIFDPFYTTKPVGMGTGLGLSICRNITTALGGEIYVQSEEGVGSRFTVWLPAMEPAEQLSPNSSSVPPPDGGQSLKVLVVDDDAFVARAIRRLLRAKHQVTLAGGGSEALELMAGCRYDVVFCDVMMPDMTGMELHQEVRRRNPDLAERFVFVTGGPFTPEARELFDRVKNPCIQKPFTPADLAQVLQSSVYYREPTAQPSPISRA